MAYQNLTSGQDCGNPWDGLLAHCIFNDSTSYVVQPTSSVICGQTFDMGGYIQILISIKTMAQTADGLVSSLVALFLGQPHLSCQLLSNFVQTDNLSAAVSRNTVLASHNEMLNC